MNFYLLGKTPDPSIDMSPLHRFLKKRKCKREFFCSQKIWKVHFIQLYLQICQNLLWFCLPILLDSVKMGTKHRIQRIAKQSNTKESSETFQKMSLFISALPKGSALQ